MRRLLTHGFFCQYELDEDKAYTMWFFDKVNPNDAVTERLDQADPTLFDGKGHEDASATTGDYDTGQVRLASFPTAGLDG